MKKGTKRIGSTLMLTGAILAGSACSSSSETPQKETKPALSTDQKLAIRALELTDTYLKDPSNGESSVSAILDTDNGPEFHGGIFGNKDICATSYSNKVSSVKDESGGSEGLITIDVDEEGNEQLYIQVVRERPDGTYAHGEVIVRASDQDCELPADPEEVIAEGIRLIETSNDITFQGGTRPENVPENASYTLEGIREATQQ